MMICYVFHVNHKHFQSNFFVCLCLHVGHSKTRNTVPIKWVISWVISTQCRSSSGNTDSPSALSVCILRLNRNKRPDKLFVKSYIESWTTLISFVQHVIHSSTCRMNRYYKNTSAPLLQQFNIIVHMLNLTSQKYWRADNGTLPFVSLCYFSIASYSLRAFP